MMSYFKTVSLSVAMALGLMFGAGCGPDGDTNNTGNTGGTPPAPPPDTVEGLCERLDECNELVGLSVSECIDLTNFCLDENFPTQSLKDDWALLVENCQEFSTCGVFVDCWLNNVPVC